MCLPLHIAYGRVFEAKPEYPIKQGVHMSAIYLRTMSAMIFTMLTGKNAAELSQDDGGDVAVIRNKTRAVL